MKTIKIALMFLGIIAVGFASGLFFYQSSKPTPEPAVQSPFESLTQSGKEKSPKQTPIVIDGEPYTASPASRGSLTHEKDIVFQSIKNGLGLITLPETDIGPIKIGDYVLVYDSHSKVLDVIGEVSSLSKPLMQKDAGKITIGVALSTLDKSLLDNITTGKIFSKDIIGKAPRLPHSAIVNGPDGTPHVWEIHEGANGTTIQQSPANITSKTDNYVVITPIFGNSNIYILNPDNRLKDGASLKIEKTLYSPPGQTKADMMAKTIYDAIAKKQAENLDDYIHTRPGGQTQGTEMAQPEPEGLPPAPNACGGGNAEGPSCENPDDWTPRQGVMQLPAPLPTP